METRDEILQRESIREFTFDIIFNDFYNRYILDNDQFIKKFNFEAIYTIAGINDILALGLDSKETVEKIKAMIKNNRTPIDKNYKIINGKAN